MGRSTAPPRWRAAARWGLPLLVMGALAGCGMIPPEPRTEAAEEVFALYNIVLVMGVIVFIGVEGFIVYAIFRYRRRDDRLPEQLHGNTLVEIIWTAIPTVIVLILFVASIITLARVEARSANPAVDIEVTGFQWQWQFHYLDGDADDGNDVTIVGSPAEPPVMVVPVGKTVHLSLTSADVIHSFYVPHFLIKRDLFPQSGDEPANELEFTVTQAGTYSGQCAEFCGDLHARMTFSVEAMEPADYDGWLTARKEGGPPPPPSGEPSGPTLELSAENIAYDTKQLEAPADEPFQVAFTNLEGVVHNMSIFRGNEKLFTGDPVTGPDETVDYQIPPLPPGQYTFICDYHPVPDMTGTLTVE